MASLDRSQCPAVESVPGNVSGAWVLRGTRMPVATIFENIKAGAKNVLRNDAYPVSATSQCPLSTNGLPVFC